MTFQRTHANPLLFAKCNPHVDDGSGRCTNCRAVNDPAYLQVKSNAASATFAVPVGQMEPVITSSMGKLRAEPGHEYRPMSIVPSRKIERPAPKSAHPGRDRLALERAQSHRSLRVAVKACRCLSCVSLRASCRQAEHSACICQVAA